jgi:hypothetical protein
MKQHIKYVIAALAGVILSGPAYGLFGSGVVVIAGDKPRTAQWALELKKWESQLRHLNDSVQEARRMVAQGDLLLNIVGDPASIYRSATGIARELDRLRGAGDGWRLADGINFQYRMNPYGQEPPGGFAVSSEAYRRIFGEDVIVDGRSFERNKDEFDLEDRRMEAFDTFAHRSRVFRDILEEETESQRRIIAELDSGDLTETRMRFLQTALVASQNRMEAARAGMAAAEAEMNATMEDIETERNRREIAAAQENSILEKNAYERAKEARAAKLASAKDQVNAPVQVSHGWEGLGD